MNSEPKTSNMVHRKAIILAVRSVSARNVIISAALACASSAMAGVSLDLESSSERFFDRESQNIALEQALTRAATNSHLSNYASAIGKNLNIDDLVWLASMSERLVKRIPDPLYRIRLLKAVLNESRANGLDPQLVLALIDVESSFQRDAVSKSGAIGLMQVMPFWLDVFEKPHADLSNPLVSLRFGCKILRHYMDRYDNVRNALAAYNGSVGFSTYPDRVTQRYLRTWRYSSKREDPLSLSANTKPLMDYPEAKSDALGNLVLPANQVALTLRPAPIVVERNPELSALSKVADARLVETSFYESQAGQ